MKIYSRAAFAVLSALTFSLYTTAALGQDVIRFQPTITDHPSQDRSLDNSNTRTKSQDLKLGMIGHARKTDDGLYTLEPVSVTKQWKKPESYFFQSR